MHDFFKKEKMNVLQIAMSSVKRVCFNPLSVFLNRHAKIYTVNGRRKTMMLTDWQLEYLKKGTTRALVAFLFNLDLEKVHSQQYKKWLFLRSDHHRRNDGAS